MNTTTITCEKPQIRLPKNFSPLKYNIDIYLNYRDLTYSAICKIELDTLIDNPRLLILNAVLSSYNIKYIQISKYDLVGDCMTQVNEGVFFTEKDIGLQSMGMEYPKIEEALYVPISNDVELKAGDRIYVEYQVEGSINICSEKDSGLYFSLSEGEYAKLAQNKTEFMKAWQESIQKYSGNSSDNGTDDDSLSISKNPLLKSIVFTAVNEPVDCRTYIPCFDEPCYKSKFNLKIILDKEYVEAFDKLKVISNGELSEIIFDPALKRYTYLFSESPLMVSYLLTFAVGNFDYLETIVNNTRLRVYTPVNRQVDGSFSLEIATKSLNYFQNYFQLPYSFPKMDLVPIPDMGYRAMENWGCIIFISYALMSDNFQALKERKYIARTVSHEISHMWFGNLVTMEWWEDIWLNEGFARMMEFICLTEIKPEFNMWDKFFELIYDSALEADERCTTHPIRIECPSPRNIGDIFDTISYSKGASVIRMLYNYIGKEDFRKSIILYLNKYQYSNANTKNLWECFTDVQSCNVGLFMDTWVDLAGHPCVIVDLVQVNEKWNLQLIQMPCMRNYNKNLSNPIWRIPLFLKTKNCEMSFLMESQECSLDIEEKLGITYDDLKNCGNFIKINSDMKGFYRVYYKKLILLTNILWFFNKRHPAVSVYDIAGLLSDHIASNHISQCLLILNSIKPITDYLILFYANKIFSIIKEHCFQHYHCSELYGDTVFNCEQDCYSESYETTRLTRLLHMPNTMKTFFKGLVGTRNEIDINQIMGKLYINETNYQVYNDECIDEYEELVLHFLTVIGEDKQVITFIVENYLSNINKLHKNFKFVIYMNICKYAYLILKDKEQERKLYLTVADDLISNFFEYSIQIRNYFRLALVSFEYASDDLVEYFVRRYFTDSELRDVYLRHLNPFRVYPENRMKFLKVYLTLLAESFIAETKTLSDGSVKMIDYITNFQAYPLCEKLLRDLFILFYEIPDPGLRDKVVNYIVGYIKSSHSEMSESDDMKKLKDFTGMLVMKCPMAGSEYKAKSERIINEVISILDE